MKVTKKHIRSQKQVFLDVMTDILLADEIPFLLEPLIFIHDDTT
jgi:hypothetical protein